MSRIGRAVRAFFRELLRDLDEYPEIHAAMDIYADEQRDRGGHFGNPTISYREAHGRNCPRCGGRGMAHMGNPPCPECGC